MVTGPWAVIRHNEASPNCELTILSSSQGREVNMRLFTITASIVALVAGVAIGDIIPGKHGEQVGHADWCGEIASKQWVANNIFHDWDPVLDQKLPECHEADKRAEALDKEHGTVERVYDFVARLFGRSEVASSVPSTSLASAP
jgi:hypothetical protein